MKTKELLKVVQSSCHFHNPRFFVGDGLFQSAVHREQKHESK